MGSTLLTARQTMQARDNRELPVRTLVYTMPNGQKATGEFDMSQVERCEICTRNQPIEHMRAHMGWEHG